MSKTAAPIIGVSGVRGVVGESLSGDLTLRLSAAFGTMIGGGKVVIGRDTRPSGRSLLHAVIAGLSGVGCDCIDTGIVPTPTVLCMVGESCAAGGVVITASHNGPEWNGLKFISGDGIFLDGKQMAELGALAGRSGEFDWKRNTGVGYCWSNEWAPSRHVGRILSSSVIDVPALRKRRFSVVADCVNGAASAVLPLLFERLGCDAGFVFDSLDGDFPRGPEPVAENLGVLADEVRRRKADIGFAFDPDGDRISMVSGSGRPFGEENSVVLASSLLLSKGGGDLVVNVSTTSGVDDIAARTGSKVLRSKVGERNVVELMKECGARAGGEGNGGVIMPEVNWGRDGITAAALFLEALLEWGDDSDSLLDSLPKYHMVKDKISWDGSLDDAEKRIRDMFQVSGTDRTDGVKFFIDGDWLHVRKSNTEPVVRVIAESKDRKRAEMAVSKTVANLRAAAGRGEG